MYAVFYICLIYLGICSALTILGSLFLWGGGGEHMAWNCELLKVLLGSPVKGQGYSGTAVLQTSVIKKKKKNQKIQQFST